ncbi:nineteen complex-related protein 2-domain-containing protein [Cyathus striatus]|nr:nineteen complex-related protein 2-domain-containing protein [Cyathus striatus]
MASPPPLIFKRTKSKPAARSRQRSPENDSGAKKDETVEESPSTVVTKLKNKVKKAKTKSRLSFGGDEEEGDGEVFQVKKSNLSKKLTLGTHPASVPLNLDQATISPSRGPTYDKKYLEQLKASTPTGRPPRPSQDAYDADMSMDVSMNVEDSTTSITTTVEEETEAYIPSESSIKVAKEKRERLRKTKEAGEDDYISLSVSKRSDFSEGPHPESRLVREDDELGEGDDEFAEYTSAQERIALGKKSKKIEERKKRDVMKEMIEDAEEEDEETMEWEQEQLRRGGHRTPEPSAKVKEVYKPAPSTFLFFPISTPIPTLAPGLARLNQQLSQLTTSHTTNTAALNSLAEERSQVDDREKEMREMVGKAEEKRAWFGSFKDWVEGVAGFLDEKYPMLEKLEEEQISLLRERFDIVAQRRRAEDEDDLTIFVGPLPPSDTDAGLEVDDSGNAVVKPDPATERRKRRAARVARRQHRLQWKKGEEEEGYSTDSSLSPGDSAAYSDAVKSLVTRKKEFRDPGKGRWSAWREKYADSYVGAWGGLVIGWDCVEDQRSLDSFKWYKGLYDYSRPGNSELGADEREMGPDGDLVASMISTAVIPRICKIIEAGALDVYSEKHIHRMVDLAEEVEASVEEGNVAMNIFTAAVSESEQQLAKHRDARKGPLSFNPEAIPARRRFLVRRVKLLKNLLRWRKYTGEKFGIGLLVGRLVEDLVLRAAQDGWDVGGEEIARKVADMLPSDLVPFTLKRLLGN